MILIRAMISRSCKRKKYKKPCSITLATSTKSSLRRPKKMVPIIPTTAVKRAPSPKIHTITLSYKVIKIQMENTRLAEKNRRGAVSGPRPTKKMKNWPENYHRFLNRIHIGGKKKSGVTWARSMNLMGISRNRRDQAASCMVIRETTRKSISRLSKSRRKERKADTNGMSMKNISKRIKAIVLPPIIAKHQALKMLWRQSHRFFHKPFFNQWGKSYRNWNQLIKPSNPLLLWIRIRRKVLLNRSDWLSKGCWLIRTNMAILESWKS